jgi:hypothetical protein
MKAVRQPSAGIRREHDFEPEHGLPEALPEGERVLWQGSPEWRHLARRAFHVRKLAVYFTVMLALRVVFLAADGVPAGQILRSLLLLGPLALVCLGILLVLARLSARTTVYTITTRRVVMRIGIVLTLTFNIPFRRIAAADLRLDADGHGDLPLTLAEGERIAWLNLWPHCRPWKLAAPQPMLRCIPRAAEVAAIVGSAWAAATSQAASARSAPSADASEQTSAPQGLAEPAMAGR